MKDRSKTGRLLRGLTGVSVTICVVTVLTYGGGAHIGLRVLNPPFGAWWNSHEFSMMELAAAALGILVGIRTGARLAGRRQVAQPTIVVSIVTGTILLPVAARLFGTLARLGWPGAGSGLKAALLSLTGYAAAGILDKILTAGVYSLKISGLGFLGGLSLFGLCSAFFLATGGARAGTPATDPRHDDEQA